MGTFALGSVKGVVFDLDDTLCGYWEAVRAGLRATFERHPLPGLDLPQSMRLWAEVFSAFCGSIKQTEWYEPYLSSGETTRTESMRRLLDAAGVPDEPLARTMSDTYAQARDAALALFPDAQSVLEALDGRYPLALLTNGPADVQRQEIATLGLGRWFRHAFIEGEMGIGKPDVRVFRHVEAGLGLRPDELVMVGNSYRHDIAGAAAAGWHTVWVRRASDIAPSSLSGQPESIPPGGVAPDCEIRELSELLPILGLQPAVR